MKRTIVTGANGFIGRRLVKKLIEHGYYVYAIVRSKEENISGLPKEVDIIYLDIKNIHRISDIIKKRINVFFHLAWDGSTGSERGNISLQLNNIKFAIESMKVAKDIGCSKFISTGTISENVIDNLDSDKLLSINMAYAISKKSTFDFLNLLSKEIKIDFVWAKLANVYGPNNETGNILSYTIKEFLKGNVPTFSEANQVYDFVYIDDVINALILIANNETSINEYFVGSGKPKILKEFLSVIGEQFGVKEIKYGVRPDDGLKYISEWFSIQRLIDDLDYTPKKDFQVNISEIINRLRKDT